MGNAAQSQVIKNFYNSFVNFKGTGCDKQAPCAFNVVFANAGNIGYCHTSPDCTNDGNEYTKAGEVKRKRDANVGGYYELANGDVIYSPVPVEVGTLGYKTVPRNATLFEQHNMDHVPDPEMGDEQYDYMMDNLDLLETSVVREVAKQG